MVGPIEDEIAEPIVKAEEQVIATVVDMDEDIAMLFGDDDFEDEKYEGFDEEEEVWEVDVPLLGERGVVEDEPMVGPIEDEIAEPIVKAEEQVITKVVDMDEDIAMLFGDDDFEDDEYEGFDEEEEPPSIYEVGGLSTVTAEGQSLPHPAPGLRVPPSVIEDLSTRLGVGNGVPDGSCHGQIQADWHSGGAGLADCDLER
nr:hypothetical protein [Tanacetum cinerariifolium]